MLSTQTMKRFKVAKSADPVYPLEIVDTQTGEVVGRYYLTSAAAAKLHCKAKNDRESLADRQRKELLG